MTREVTAAFRGALVAAVVASVVYALWWLLSPTTLTKTEIPWSHGVMISPWWNVLSYAVTGAFLGAFYAYLLPPDIKSKDANDVVGATFLGAILCAPVWMILSLESSSAGAKDLPFNPILMLPSIFVTIMAFVACLVAAILMGVWTNWILQRG